ncbi:hypothetical protein Q760_10215 [Cellulomonas cellasea DSM 20118]|uniref:Uncharacterized protein n=2 Tax=Cellulomonas cellasea TaxID=43670 RepID=A0A0A0BCP2_9CELL|nr:hypothetical protein [Cellulomonas cellasea]KGM03852.1 hypothetical protein Q760_10215 [Cellulomonas cellasea DSM 20118]GEA87245.1 hypothetical protein CCE01nite_11940 [Cellulomonas cellasea]
MSEVRSRVRLMNEYSVAWPLWVTGGATRDDAPPISEPLSRELRAWARVFDKH